MELRDFVHRCKQSYPDKVAYIDGDRTFTWSDVFGRSRRLAAALQCLGVAKGEVVAMLSYDHIEAVEHFFACMEIGAVRVGVNRGYAPKEIAHVVRDSEAKVLIVQASCVALVKDHLVEFAREGCTIVGFGQEHGQELDYERLIAAAPLQPERVDIQGKDPAAISYTSGTTGYPKGVIFKQSGMRDMFIHFVLSTGLRHEDTWLNPTSMAWATFMLNVMSIVNGMTTVLQGADFKAESFLDLCTRHRVTSIVAVPVMLQRLIATYDQDRQRWNLSTLRLVTYGSAPASPALIQSAINTFKVELIQLYGLSEFCAWATFLQHGDHIKALDGRPEILTSCGRPGLHCELSIRDENGAPVARGEMGELWLRSETLMLGYKHLPELTAEVLHGDWLRTHDIGMEDEDGYIHLTDRRHFLIITGAANVFPSIVENTLASHPQVREVAVVGAPHPEWGEAVVAMVALKAPGAATAAELIQHCHGKVAKWEVPKFIEIVADLPKGPTLKILKKQIKDRYASEGALLPWNSQ
jgi:acyl-CoA synthetase (AMP-forming)/AMP-acid ligase II